MNLNNRIYWQDSIEGISCDKDIEDIVSNVLRGWICAFKAITGEDTNFKHTLVVVNTNIEGMSHWTLKIYKERKC